MASPFADEIVHGCLAVRIRLISRAVTGIYDRAIERHGLTIAQVNLLAAVDMAGPCAPTTLGDILQLERSTVSRNLSLLLKQGWIDAKASDAKGVREVALTRTGRKKLESVMPDWRYAQDQATQLVGAEGAEAIRALAANLSDLPTG